MPWSVTLISACRSSAMRVHDDDSGVLGAVGDRVVDEVAHRGDEQLLVAVDLQALTAADGERDVLGLGLEPAPVDGVVRRRRRASTTLGSATGSPPCSRDSVDQVLDDVGQADGLVLHAPGEPAYGLGVVGGVLDRLGQQRQRADRGLELVADVGHEVAADRVDAAQLGEVLGEDQDQARASPSARRARRTSGPRAPAVDDLDLLLADLAVAAYERGPSARRESTTSRSPRTRPKARAAELARRTRSSRSTTTAEERRTLEDRGDAGGQRRGLRADVRTAAAHARWRARPDAVDQTGHEPSGAGQTRDNLHIHTSDRRLGLTRSAGPPASPARYVRRKFTSEPRTRSWRSDQSCYGRDCQLVPM